MSETKKINLSAMMKHANPNMDNSGAKEAPPEDMVKTDITSEEIPIDSKPVATKINRENKSEDAIIPPIETSDTKQSGDQTQVPEAIKIEKPKNSSKISLSTIKAKKVKKEAVIEAPKKKIVKDEKTLYFESLTSKVLSSDEKKTKISPLKNPLKPEGASLIKKPKLTSGNIIGKNISIKQESDGETHVGEKEESILETSCELSKKDEYIKNISKAVANSGDVFSNYESDYKKKENSILNTIKRLTKVANIKKLTKTNKIFVGGIIASTILGVSFLFYVDPDVHSIENYKTSILNLAGNRMTQEEIDLHQKDIMNDIAWKLTQNNLGGYQLDFEILVNSAGMAVYKFDGNEYKNKGELDIAIQKKLTELKVDKIRNYLKNKL